MCSQTEQNAKTLFFDGSPDQGQSYASVIPVLMVLALRSGQVDGTPIDKVLDKSSRCDGQTIQWKYPERPVLSCGIIFPLNECPMGSQHFERAIFRMGLVAGILEECKAQARRWAIMDGLNGVDSVMDAHKPTLAAAAVRKAIVDKWEAEEFGADPASDSGAVSPSSMDEEHCRWPIRLIDGETAPDDVDAHVLKALIGLVTVTPDVEDDRLARSDYNDAFIIAGYNHDYAARSKKSQIDVVLTKPADEFVQYFSSIRDG